jgi:hypothetical protein
MGERGMTISPRSVPDNSGVVESLTHWPRGYYNTLNNVFTIKVFVIITIMYMMPAATQNRQFRILVYVDILPLWELV